MQSTIYKNLNEGLDSTKREIPISAADISYSTEVTFNKCEFSHLEQLVYILEEDVKIVKL